VLLFQKKFHEGLVSGAVTLTFRRWDKPHVKPGGRYRCHPIGVLVCDGVERVRLREITDDDARRSGFESREALLEYIRTGPGAPVADDTELWRVQLHHGGDGDRVEIALDDALAPADVALLRKKLARLDAKTKWTAKTLALIEEHPRIAASQLAKRLRRETLPFKTDVRKLKKLGLTQSFEVGYEISPRGRAYLALTRKPPRPRRP
jgi:hypothetical protein